MFKELKTIYPIPMYLVIGKDNFLRKQTKFQYTDAQGFTVFNENGIFICVNTEKSNNLKDTTYHEVLHGCLYMWEKIGEKIRYDNDESFVYFVTDIFKQALIE